MINDALINKQILDGIANKDIASFECFFNCFHNRVYSYSFHFTKNQEDSEEIVQEIFAKIWSKPEILESVENISQWMKTVTRNRCLSYLKKKALIKRKEQESIFFSADVIADSEKILERRDFNVNLSKALDLLTPQQKKIFELAKIEGLKRNAICQQLNLSPATVSSHLGQSVRIVRESLKKHFHLIFLIIFLKF